MTITAVELAAHFGETITDPGDDPPNADQAKWAQVRAVAVAMVEAEVGDPTDDPPAAVLNEATIRVAGLLVRDRASARLTREIAGEVPSDNLGARLDYLPIGESMRIMRTSGARALLSPFKARVL